MISTARFIEEVLAAFSHKLQIALAPANTPAEQATGIQLEYLANDNHHVDTSLVLTPLNGNISNDELSSAITWLKQVANSDIPEELNAIETLSTFVQDRGDITKLLQGLGFREESFDDQDSGIFTTAGSQVGAIQGGQHASQGEVIDSVIEAVPRQWVAGKSPAAVPASFSRESAVIADAIMESMIGNLGKTLQDDKQLVSDIKNELNKDTLSKLYSDVLARIDEASQASLRVTDLPSMLEKAGIPEPNVIVKSKLFASDTLQILSGNEVLAVIPYNSNTQSIEVKGAEKLLQQLGDRYDKILEEQPVFQEAANQRDAVESFMDIRWADPWKDPTTTEPSEPPSTTPEQPGSTDPDPSGQGEGTSNPQNEQGG